MSDLSQRFRKLSEDDRQMILDAINSHMYGNYFDIYEKYGLRRTNKRVVDNVNFKCPNNMAHNTGDSNPSFTVNNKTGQFHCKGCGYSGAFGKYYVDYGKDAKGGLPYIDEFVKFCGLEKYLDVGIKREAADMDELRARVEKFSAELEAEKASEGEKKNTPLDIDEYNINVKRLLGDKYMMETLRTQRAITPQVVNEYRIGLDKDDKTILFPQFDLFQNLVNVKGYKPLANPGQQKWKFLDFGGPRDTWPSPLRNLGKSKIYIFEGEPDAYCAISLGYNGVTAGSASSVNMFQDRLGEQFNAVFGNKEIVICMDTDAAGSENAVKLAKVLLPIAAQVKIVNLDKTDKFPEGLDPEATKEFVDQSGKSKKKRSEKDFTDFMCKHGFGDLAKQLFMKKENETPVFSDNPNRSQIEVFKTSVNEAGSRRYFDAYGLKEVEVVASILTTSDSPYNMPSELNLECPACSGSKSKSCDFCLVKKMIDTESEDADVRIELSLMRGKIKKIEKCGDNHYFMKLKADELISLIDTSRDNNAKVLRQLLQIPKNCTLSNITFGAITPIHEVTIERALCEKDDKHQTKTAAMTCFVPTDTGLLAGHSYRIKGVISTHHKNMRTVMYATSTESLSQSSTAFKMTPDVNELLMKFQPKEYETVAETMKRRSQTFCKAIGLKYREDLMTGCEMALFSATSLKHPRLADYGRGFLDVAIIGATSTGKSMAAQFLLDHFGVGELVQCGGNNTYAGLVAGINSKTQSVTWGKIPMNHGGFIVMDEAQNLSITDLESMNSMRRDGTVKIDKIQHNETKAMVRKIWISNDRGVTNQNGYVSIDSDLQSKDLFLAVKQVYSRDAIVSRFDFVMTAVNPDGDVMANQEFEDMAAEFNDVACQMHVRWAHSREPDDIVTPNETEDAVNNAAQRMRALYHKNTLLVTEEIGKKIYRAAVSVAMIMYSVVPGNPEKVLVKPEHVEFVEDFLNRLYSVQEFNLVAISNSVRTSQQLGDMTFLPSVLRFVDARQLMMTSEYARDTLKSMFSDYLINVNRGTWYIVDAMSDRFTTGHFTNDSFDKLINVLTTRNFLKRGRYGFTLSAAGRTWLEDYLNEPGNGRYQPDYLYVSHNQPDDETGQVGQKNGFGTGEVGVKKVRV